MVHCRDAISFAGMRHRTVIIPSRGTVPYAPKHMQRFIKISRIDIAAGRAVFRALFLRRIVLRPIVTSIASVAAVASVVPVAAEG
jgi:hypothetical protein